MPLIQIQARLVHEKEPHGSTGIHLAPQDDAITGLDLNRLPQRDRNLGSVRSRSPSPSAFRPTTMRARTAPGIATTQRSRDQ